MQSSKTDSSTQFMLVRSVFAYIGQVCNTLTLIFVTLKLTGLIDWSWWLVLLPFIIQWSIILVLTLLLVAVLTHAASQKRR
jgi:hypothetical protein